MGPSDKSDILSSIKMLVNSVVQTVNDRSWGRGDEVPLDCKTIWTTLETGQPQKWWKAAFYVSTFLGVKVDFANPEVSST